MAFWLDIAAFVLKAVIIVAAIGGLAVLIARLARSSEPKDQEIKVRSLDERYDDMRDAMDGELLDRKERKALAKSRKKEAKAAAKTRRAQEPGKRIFVLTFKGDMRASAVKRLGAEIDAVLIAARPETDETVIRIESPGGTVTGYGLAAAEILRLRDRKIKVTASVDQVAASGGYMMACAADRIVAAPFAIVGSIGVVAPVPNLHRLLKKNEIDFEEITAGEFKRTRLRPRRDHAGGPRTFPREARHDPRRVQGARRSVPSECGHRPRRQWRLLAGARRACSRPRRRDHDGRRPPVPGPRPRAPLRSLD